MNVKFRITEDDYVNAMLLHGKMPRGIRFCFAVLLVIFVLNAIYGTGEDQWTAGVLLAGFVLAMLIRHIFVPREFRRQYRKHEAIRAEFSARLVEEGIHLSTAYSDIRIVWNNVSKWRHNDDYLLLYLTPCIFYVIPKTAVRDGFDLRSFMGGLYINVGVES